MAEDILGQRRLAVVEKPPYSRASISRKNNQLRIVVSGVGFSPSYALGVAFSVVWMVMNVHLIFFSGDFVSFVAGIIFLTGGIFLFYSSLYPMYGKERTTIDQTTIYTRRRLFLCFSQSSKPALRQYISKIERTQSYYKTVKDNVRRRSANGTLLSSYSTEGIVKVSSRLLVHAGARVFEIGRALSLSEIELDWLAYELGHFLELPVS